MGGCDEQGKKEERFQGVSCRKRLEVDASERPRPGRTVKVTREYKTDPDPLPADQPPQPLPLPQNKAETAPVRPMKPQPV